jgi:hypothetical protein
MLVGFRTVKSLSWLEFGWVSAWQFSSLSTVALLFSSFFSLSPAGLLLDTFSAWVLLNYWLTVFNLSLTGLLIDSYQLQSYWIDYCLTVFSFSPFGLLLEIFQFESCQIIAWPFFSLSPVGLFRDILSVSFVLQNLLPFLVTAITVRWLGELFTGPRLNGGWSSLLVSSVV